MLSERTTCRHSQYRHAPSEIKRVLLSHPGFHTVNAARQHRNCLINSFPSWTSNGSITAKNKKERLSWRLSEITDPSPTQPSPEQQTPLPILQPPRLQHPHDVSQPEEISLLTAASIAEPAQQASIPVTTDSAATISDGTDAPDSLSIHQPITLFDASIMYTEEMLRASQPAVDSSHEPSGYPSPIPILSSLPVATTPDESRNTPDPELLLPSTSMTTTQPSLSLVLTQMPGYGPEQRSFLVVPSASGFSLPSDSSLLETGQSTSEVDLLYNPAEQQQQPQPQLARQIITDYDPQAEVKMVHRVPPKSEQPPKPDPVFWGGFLNKCRLAYDVFFPPKPVERVQLSGKEVVMSRLQMVLVADRCGISPEALIAMKNSTVLGLAKYMEADMSEMEMQVSAVKPSGKRITMSLGFNKIMEDYMLRDPDNYHYQCEDDDDYFMEDDGYVSEIQEGATTRGLISTGGGQ